MQLMCLAYIYARHINCFTHDPINTPIASVNVSLNIKTDKHPSAQSPEAGLNCQTMF